MTTWDNISQGQAVRTAWETMRDTYTNKVPGHTDQLRTLAQKPIGG